MASYSTISGSDGSYSLTVESGTYTVTVSKVGYQPITMTNVNAATDVNLGISTLTPIPGTTTPWGPTILDAGTYRIIMPTQTVINNQTYIFQQWEDGSTDPVRIINLIADTIVTATYEAVTPPPTPSGMCPAAIIATCIYGPSIELNIIRAFRDKFMSRTASGRWLTRSYYRIGKHIAKWLYGKALIQLYLKGYLDLIVRTLKRRGFRSE